MAKDSKPGQIALPESPGQQASSAEKSFADFFDKMSGLLAQLQNVGRKPTDTDDGKRFEFYSQAYQGFAQNNVSKKESFTIENKLPDRYKEKAEELIKEKRRKDISQ